MPNDTSVGSSNCEDGDSVGVVVDMLVVVVATAVLVANVLAVLRITPAL